MNKIANFLSDHYVEGLMVIIPLALIIFLVSCAQKKTGKETEPKSKQLTTNLIQPEWSKDLVIYEVNIRQYTPEGTINAFAEHLPRLKELGVDILWLMPIYPIGEENRKGTMGSYYAVKDYKAVNPNFGTIDDLKGLVKKAHELDMYVILDWVANHTAWDHVWADTHPQFYEKDSIGGFISPYDWTDVIQLDYKNDELRNAMIDALKFWVVEANVDGYRCDVAGMVPTDFWEDARTVLESTKPVFMLAEAEEAELLLNAFNMDYAWELHHIMNAVAKGEKKASAFADYFNKQDTGYVDGAIRMNFTSNHDENSWNGTVFERMGDAVKTFAVFSYTIPGMPLIYNGQETGLNKRLEFFEKDQIDWDEGSEFFPFYMDLNVMKKEQRALWNEPYGGDMEIIETGNENIFAFKRTKEDNTILAIFNFSDQEQVMGFDVEDGFSLIISDEDDGTNLSPWGYRVYFK